MVRRQGTLKLMVQDSLFLSFLIRVRVFDFFCCAYPVAGSIKATCRMFPFDVSILSLTPWLHFSLHHEWFTLLLRRLTRECLPVLLKLLSSTSETLSVLRDKSLTLINFVSSISPLFFVCVLFIPSPARYAPLPRENRGTDTLWHYEGPIVPIFCRVLRSLSSSACVASRGPSVPSMCSD